MGLFKKVQEEIVEVETTLMSFVQNNLVAVIVCAVVLVSALLFFSVKQGKKKQQDAPKKVLEQFVIAKELSLKDRIVIDMLNTTLEEMTCWCVTDPALPDNPIVYSSPGFCNFTGYDKKEIEGTNCRFLQGPKTDPKDVAAIRKAIAKKVDANVCLLNYRKDGTTFMNQFFLCPLLNKKGKVVYYLGVQVEVQQKKKGGYIENPGWIYTQGNHV